MTPQEELVALEEQRASLKQAASLVYDVALFFEKNSIRMTTQYDSCCLGDIADEIMNDSDTLGEEITELKEFLGIPEDDDDSVDL